MVADERLGTSILLENARVRVWEHRVAPGQTGHLHTHRRPYLSVVVRGSAGDTLDAAGEVIDHFVLAPGTPLWYCADDLPETHALRNTGEDEILIVTTELLT